MRNNQRRDRGSSQTPAVFSAPTTPGLTYEVPTEFVVLPSRGLFYPEGHPLCNQETVEIRFMTAKEEDILASQTLSDKGLTIDRLLSSIIVQDLDPESLLIGDRNAIMIAARISAYGNEYPAAVLCHSCNMRLDYSFDLEKINLHENCFDEKFLKEHKITFDSEIRSLLISLPKSGVEVGLRMLDGADEKTLNSEIDDGSAITSTLARFISHVEKNEDPDHIKQFIDNMPAADSVFLRNLYPKLVPNIDLKQPWICKNCANAKDVEVPLNASFFWPE